MNTKYHCPLCAELLTNLDELKDVSDSLLNNLLAIKSIFIKKIKDKITDDLSEYYVCRKCNNKEYCVFDIELGPKSAPGEKWAIGVIK